MSDAGDRKQEVATPTDKERPLGTPVGSSEDEFEAALTRALRRVEVRAETSAKFLAIAAEAAAQRKRTGKLVYRPKTGGLLVMLPRPKVWLSGAIAAVLVAGVFVAQDVHQRHEREVANREFALSMQIEERAMEHTRQQLQKAGVPLE